MFWVLLIALYVIPLLINPTLLRLVWYKWYPIHIYQIMGESVDQFTIIKSQFRAILLFGLFQPILASIPLLFGGQWWHYVLCVFASAAYSASGSARFFLDRVRSSLLMRLGTLVSFAIGAIVFTIFR